MRTVICILTYDERENLEPLVEEILGTAEVDVLIVDDDSPDGTGKVADALAERTPRVKVIHRDGPSSIAKAYVQGFHRALEDGYDQIFQMDADFSHQPRYLPSMLDALKNADVVTGSRYVEGGGVDQWSLARRVASRAGNAYCGMVLNMPYRDATSGFVGFKRHVLEAVEFDALREEGRAFQVELKYRAHRLGFTIVEVPIHFWDRVSGRSKMTPARALSSVWNVLKVRLAGEPGGG